MKIAYLTLILIFALFISVGCASAADTKAPVITKSDPYNGQTNVELSKTVKVTFNENIVFDNWNIILKNVKTGNAVPIELSHGSNYVSINPSNNLPVNTQFRVEIHTGSVVDLAGNPVSSKSFTFTTRPYKYTSKLVTYTYSSMDYGGDTGYYHDATFLTVYWKHIINGYRFGVGQPTFAVMVVPKTTAVSISKVDVYGYYYAHEVSGDRIVSANTYYSAHNKWLKPPYGYWFDYVMIHYKVRS